MRGESSALALGPGEASDFPLQEAAFYGNFFDDTDIGDSKGNNGNRRNQDHDDLHGNHYAFGHENRDFTHGHGPACGGAARTA